MKKCFSVLLICALVLSLVSVSAVTGVAAQRSLSLLGAAADDVTETQSGEETAADATTGQSGKTVKKGDVNGDAGINMKDVLAVRKFIAGIEVSLDTSAADVNNDNNVNMKDVLLLRKYIAGMLDSLGDDETSAEELNLIKVITNGSDEADGTAITDEGSGYVIAQTKSWNVWVLYFNENTQSFGAASGAQVYLEFDMTLSGDAHLTVNGWDNSIAAAIADACAAATTPAEDGTPMLIQGTYTGRVAVDPSQFGETGRLGIVGSGAIIRTFTLTTRQTAATTASTSEATASLAAKTAPPTEADTPYLNYNTDETFGSLGVWWWDADTIVEEEDRTKRLNFLQQNHVTEIYLCVGSQSYTQLAVFIKDAASRGMRVAWLSGDVSWIQAGNTGFDKMLAHFKAYQNQAAANEKFYGLHLDVEPHQAGSTQANWQLYANLVVRATAAAHEYGTVIEWDIPFWLDSMAVTVEGETKQLLTLLAETSDCLTLMSYRDTAAAILSAGAQEIPLGTEYNCKIVLGTETYSEEGAHVSFMEDGKAALYTELQSVFTALSEKTTLGAGYGCAVHYIETWMQLQN